MPSTITTYYTFQPATKARSSQVNTNFSNYRGDLLPINEATATASDGVHNLGASDHRWLTGYVHNLDFVSSTSTAGLTLSGDTTATTGAYLFKIGGTLKAKITPSGLSDIAELSLVGSTSTTNMRLVPNTAVTTGAADLLFGNSTIASYDIDGLQRRSIDVSPYTTTGAPIGTYCYTGQTTSISKNVGQSWTITVSKIKVRTGGLVSVKILNSSVQRTNPTVAGWEGYSKIEIYRGSTITSLSLIHTGGSAIGRFITSTINIVTAGFDYEFIDSSYTGSEVVYGIVFTHDTDSTSGATIASSAAVLIKEI